MEVFWFMKKVFFKKATCFLLILLMTMFSTIVACFAGGHKRESECSERQEECTSGNKSLNFNDPEEKLHCLGIFNEWCIYFNASPKNENADISVEEFLQLCNFLSKQEYLSEDYRNELFAYLAYYAEMNNIDI